MQVFVYYRNLSETKVVWTGTLIGQINVPFFIGKTLKELNFPLTPDYFKDVVLVQWAISCDELLLIFQQPVGVEDLLGGDATVL